MATGVGKEVVERYGVESTAAASKHFRVGFTGHVRHAGICMGMQDLGVIFRIWTCVIIIII